MQNYLLNFLQMHIHAHSVAWGGGGEPDHKQYIYIYPKQTYGGGVIR